MKKVVFTLVFALIGLVAMNAQEITFEQETIDYGEVLMGSDGNKVFKFKNTGDKPLLIKSVKPSCGCTVADYPKDPIAPGNEGEIKVSYDTKRPNAFSKTITVYSNDANEGRKILRIKGKVLAEQ